MAASRTLSRERRSATPGPVGDSHPQSDHPGAPVISGENVPHGVCKYAWRGMKCPFENDKVRNPNGCTFSHDVQKYKGQKQNAAPAPQPQEGNDKGQSGDQDGLYKGANSPRISGEDQIAKDF